MSTRVQLTKGLNHNIKNVLGHDTKIYVKYYVKLEIKEHKSDDRILVFTPARLYVLMNKVPTKIESHIHYLDIRTVESKTLTQFSLVVRDKLKKVSYYTFITTSDESFNASAILTTLATAIKRITPSVPIKYIVDKIDIQPEAREEQVFSDAIVLDPKKIGPCDNFSTQYYYMCDYHGVLYREEVAWDIDTIYLSHDIRMLNLRDFDHLESKDLMSIVSALEYNTYFRGIKATHMRLSNETLERLLRVLKRSMWLEELHLEQLGLKPDFLQKLEKNVSKNENCALRTIDLSHNSLEDKGGMLIASGPIKNTKQGICKLSLSCCGLTSKSINEIVLKLSNNQNIASSLTYLDLSNNSLKDDVRSLQSFLGRSNCCIKHLNLSATDTYVESFSGAFLYGCTRHLEYLDVSHNSFKLREEKNIPNSFKEFFSGTLSLKYLNVSNCKIPPEALKNLLLGLACNTNIAGLHLDLSGNSLGSSQGGSQVLESCIHGVTCLRLLDISDNNLESDIAQVLAAISKNPSIKCLYISRSFNGIKPKHIPGVIDALVNMIQKDDFCLEELVLSDNKLKNDIHDFINALGSNQTLETLDISGNYMGDVGARLLAKALQINNKLRTIIMDKNNITLQGYSDIVYALENNYSLCSIPFPLHDMTQFIKNHAEKTDAIMRKMQELLHSNCSGLKRTNAQSFRLQHGYMLSSTNQLIDKLVAEVEETMSLPRDCYSGHDNYAPAPIRNLLRDAEICKDLMSKLQEETIKTQPHRIEVELKQIAAKLSTTIHDYLEQTINEMISIGTSNCQRLQNVADDLRKTLYERLKLPNDFFETYLVDKTGSEIINKVREIEQSIAATISERATDEVLEALTRCKRGLEITDSPLNLFEDEPQTPDIVRSRSNHESDRIILRYRGLNFPKTCLTSPTATPHFLPKRQSITGKIRPQSVIDNLSVGHIPDLLGSPQSDQSSTNASPSKGNCSSDGAFGSITDAGGDDECNDSITELPSTSGQLKHLVSERPKRVKTRAPTRCLLAANASNTQDISEGFDHFFGARSTTPNTLTPPVKSPTYSDDCSSLSIVDSPTMSRDDNGRFNSLTSEETTPILEERKSIKLDRSSPFLKGISWSTRSRSSDNLEKYSPLVGRKSPLVRMQTENDGRCEKIKSQKYQMQSSSVRSPSTESIKNHININTSGSIAGIVENNSTVIKTGNGLVRKPIVLQKPRPWSVVGNEPKPGDFNSESSKTTPDTAECDVVPFGQNQGGSIVGISPGVALSAGGSIVGITPGAALEKKSVRELAAGLNRLVLNQKPSQLLSRSSLNSSNLTSLDKNSDEEFSSKLNKTLKNNNCIKNEKTEEILSMISMSSSSSSKSGNVITKGDIVNSIKSSSSVTTLPTEGKTIAGKHISSSFEEILVEGLQRASIRQTPFGEAQNTKDNVYK